MTSERYRELVERSEELAQRSRQLMERAEKLGFDARSTLNRAHLWHEVIVRQRVRLKAQALQPLNSCRGTSRELPLRGSDSRTTTL